MINTVTDDMEATTPALSDCDSYYGSEYSGHSVESPLTPPLSTLDDVDDQALDAYRRKGRRNAFSTDFQDGYGFPIFLGRQDEGEVEELAPITRNAPQELSQTLSPATKRAEEIPASHHVSAVEGTMMSWWPEPLENMEADWTVEKTQWQLRLEKEKLKEIERENGIIKKEKKSYTGQYGAAPVDSIDGPLMNWWPTPLYDWSERFYE
ncbi:hypothetical protein F4678DRAFT_436599 [Xylaria arbuscula]|nr:hypothetical protein F4678DRAFT_436599 [Xylaria arbuscula]